MTGRIVIEFSEEATRNYLKVASELTEAEVNADCEPSGLNIWIQVDPVFGCEAFVGKEELGAVALKVHDD